MKVQNRQVGERDADADMASVGEGKVFLLQSVENR